MDVVFTDTGENEEHIALHLNINCRLNLLAVCKDLAQDCWIKDNMYNKI